jgi:hypothetical protein
LLDSPSPLNTTSHFSASNPFSSEHFFEDFWNQLNPHQNFLFSRISSNATSNGLNLTSLTPQSTDVPAQHELTSKHVQTACHRLYWTFYPQQISVRTLKRFNSILTASHTRKRSLMISKISLDPLSPSPFHTRIQIHCLNLHLTTYK